MKILYVGDLNSVHLRRWIRYFADEGHEVHVLTPRLRSAPPRGVSIHRQPRVRTRVRLIDYAANAAVLPLRVLAFVRLARRLRPDIVHVHYLNDAALIAVLAAARPLVFTAWGSDVVINPKRSTALRWMLAYAVKRADLLTCDANHVKHALAELGANPAKIALVYFGTDTAVFHPGARDAALRARLGVDGGPSIISIRTLAPLYDVGTLVRAFANVVAHCPSARLVIGGTGPEMEGLRETARALGIDAAVRFVGWIAEDDLPRHLASCDVYVSTALSDGGLAASTAEAMACALPVIVTDVGDNREWVHDGVHGYVVPVRDSDALASRIVALLDEDESRQLGRNGRALIDQKDNWAVEMGRMGAYYHELAARRSSENAARFSEQ